MNHEADLSPLFYCPQLSVTYYIYTVVDEGGSAAVQIMHIQIR